MSSVDRARKKGISTLIATLIIITLIIAASVLLYAYTMGHLGNVNQKLSGGNPSGSVAQFTNGPLIYAENTGEESVKIDHPPNRLALEYASGQDLSLRYISNPAKVTEAVALVIDSVTQHDGGLHIYLRNVGKDSVTIDSPPDTRTSVYVNDMGWNLFRTIPNPSILTEGATCEFVIFGLDSSFVGKTAKIKIVTISGAFTQTDIKITSDALSPPGALTLNVKPAGTGSGTVTLDPSGGSYTLGTVVTLKANPQSGTSFSGWGGDLTGTANPTTIIMDGNKAVTATFNLITPSDYALSITVVGVGSVAKSPNKATYHLGDSVQLTATPEAGYTFTGWNGDFTESSNPATLTIDATPTVTAIFTQNQYTLTVNIVGTGCSVTLSPNQATYNYGTSVKLTPVPATSYSFTGWGGDLEGNSNPVTIIITGDKALTATFTPWPIILRPNAPGAITDLARQGDSENWRCVDQASSDDLTYVYQPPSFFIWDFRTDTYNLQDPTHTGTITNVRIHIMCSEDNGWPGSQARTAISLGSGPVQYGATQDLTATWTDYYTDYPTKTGNLGSGAWTWSDIDNLQIGASLYSRDYLFWTTTARTNQVWVEITTK